MARPFLRQLKKQTSSFFRQNLRKVRLAITDVTLAQLLTKEVISKSRRNPDPRIMLSISKAAFEVDDYSRIVEILHRRFAKFDDKQWWKLYKALVLLEHLLIHGPKSSVDEFQSDREVIKQMRSFQHIDEKGFNSGLSLKTIADRVLQLLEGGNYLQEERDRLRSITLPDGVFASPILGYSSTNTLEGPSYNLRRSNSGYEYYSRRREAVLHAEVDYEDYDAQIYDQSRKASHVDESSERERGNKGVLPTEKTGLAEVPKLHLAEEYEPLLEDNEDYTSLGMFGKHGIDWVQFQ